MFAQQTPRFTSFFFFNDTATTEIYTLSLHDALPISAARSARPWASPCSPPPSTAGRRQRPSAFRSDAPRCSTCAPSPSPRAHPPPPRKGPTRSFRSPTTEPSQLSLFDGDMMQPGQLPLRVGPRLCSQLAQDL